jgi:hypothetical protein
MEWAHGLAANEGCIGCSRCFQCLVGRKLDDRIQRRVHCVDAFNAGGNDFSCGDLAGANGGGYGHGRGL